MQRKRNVLQINNLKQWSLDRHGIYFFHFIVRTVWSVKPDNLMSYTTVYIDKFSIMYPWAIGDPANQNYDMRLRFIQEFFV